MRMLASLVSGLFLIGCALAQELPMVEFSYHEGFERGECPVKEWVSNGKYQINFMGISDEQAAEGSRSFKLDITIESGSYHYFHVPLRVPVEGELTFSGKILVTHSEGISVGLGPNYVFPPTRHSGCGPFDSVRGVTDGWKEITGNLGAGGAQSAQEVLSRYVAGATGENVGRYLDRWGIFVRGGAGRLVVYVDDVRIEGKVADEGAYQAVIANRWAGYAAKWAEMVAGWKQRVEAAAAAFEGAVTLPPELASLRQSALTAVERARAEIARLEGVGYASAVEVAALEAGLRAAEAAPAVIARVSDALAAGRRMLVLRVPAMSNARILPDDLAVPGEVVQGLEVSACAGEYESLSIVVLAISDLRSLLVAAGDLVSEAGTIGSSEVDIKLVKVWYQAGRGIGDLKHKQLVPELLLNDDALVRVDTQQQANYLRSTAEDGTTTYVLASNPDPDSRDLEGVRPIDAPTLQPVDLPALRVQQYWVTVHVPDGTRPGQYRGVLRVTAAGLEPVEMPLLVHVYPFALAPSPLTYSVYYRGRLRADNTPGIDSEWRSEEQYLAEMRHLAAHGVLYPTIYQGYDERLLPRALQLRLQAGLPNDQLFTLGVSTGAPQTEEELAALRERVRQYMNLARSQGFARLFVYGIDEAKGERLLAQRQAWQAVQEEGAYTFVAGYKGTFEAMGSLLNVAVLAGPPDAEEAAKFHSVGSRVFCYANPQVGPEEPETFRRNYGLLLWRAGFDGAMDYAYQHGFGHVWNDFDHTTYRDHNFAYPTVNGVVGTVQIEGYREACDDVRYLATLLAAIERCRDPQAQAAARAWVQALDPTRNLDEVRAEMVQHILRCMGLE